MEQDKFYRRAYNLIKDLRKLYENGYEKDTIEKYRKIEILKDDKVFKSEVEALSSILITCLIGINKESLEKKFEDLYCKEIFDYDFRSIFSAKTKDKFDSKKIKNTKYDKFLSISKFDGTVTKEEQYIDFIRNAFLHSQFKLDIYDGFSTTFIKNKNFFEAYLLNPNFYNYIVLMFSNIPTLGKTAVNKNKIN